MAGKAISRHKAHGAYQDAPPMTTCVELALGLTFEAAVEVDVTELLQTVPDAIFEYDRRHRLLPGVPTPPAERLIGSGVELRKVSREVRRELANEQDALRRTRKLGAN
jgi:hypothetical protein